MVSNQCESKVQSILGALPDEDVQIVKPELIGLRDVFQVDEDEDDDEGQFTQIPHPPNIAPKCHCAPPPL